jgi:L-alanine-DL-glutamate epimerase-like enolase superfamily enzyme
VRRNGLDLLQTDHALSGIDIALWDLLGRREKAPVWSFFTDLNLAKTGYASQLFGENPAETFEAAKKVAQSFFRAAKFGWGPLGHGSVEVDVEHLEAAREGLGPDRTLLVDTGCVFEHDVERASLRIEAMERVQAAWWEEPFNSGALSEYAQLAARTRIPLAGGEGAHNVDQAKHLIDYGGVKTIQIDTGRIGGITAAREVAVYAAGKGVPFVNHTFTSNLALSASLQPYSDSYGLAEVPVETSALARAIGGETWPLDANGSLLAPVTAGLGISPDLSQLRPFLQEVEIKWNGKVLWSTRTE